MSETIIVANRTGGQGKTVAAQLLIWGMEVGGLEPRRIAIDSIGEGTKSKFGKFCKRVREIRVSPDQESLRSDSKAMLAHWDAVGKELLNGGAVIDVGANVIDSIFAWAAARNAGSVLAQRKAPPVTLVVPAQAQAQALEDALHLLERSITEGGNLQITRRVLLLNEAFGGFDTYGTNEDFTRLQRMKEEHGLRIGRLRKCTSALWPFIERLYLNMADVTEMDPSDMEKKFGLNPFEAAGAQVDFLQWALQSLRMLNSLGLTPDNPCDQGDDVSLPA